MKNTLLLILVIALWASSTNAQCINSTSSIGFFPWAVGDTIGQTFVPLNTQLDVFHISVGPSLTASGQFYLMSFTDILFVSNWTTDNSDLTVWAYVQNLDTSQQYTALFTLVHGPDLAVSVTTAYPNGTFINGTSGLPTLDLTFLACFSNPFPTPSPSAAVSPNATPLPSASYPSPNATYPSPNTSYPSPSPFPSLSPTPVNSYPQCINASSSIGFYRWNVGEAIGQTFIPLNSQLDFFQIFLQLSSNASGQFYLLLNGYTQFMSNWTTNNSDLTVWTYVQNLDISQQYLALFVLFGGSNVYVSITDDYINGAFFNRTCWDLSFDACFSEGPAPSPVSSPSPSPFVWPSPNNTYPSASPVTNGSYPSPNATWPSPNMTRPSASPQRTSPFPSSNITFPSQSPNATQPSASPVFHVSPNATVPSASPFPPFNGTSPFPNNGTDDPVAQPDREQTAQSDSFLVAPLVSLCLMLSVLLL